MPPPPGQGTAVWFQAVTPGYFETMGMELVRGRPLGAEDHAGAPPAGSRRPVGNLHQVWVANPANPPARNSSRQSFWRFFAIGTTFE